MTAVQAILEALPRGEVLAARWTEDLRESDYTNIELAAGMVCLAHFMAFAATKDALQHGEENPVEELRCGLLAAINAGLDDGTRMAEA